MPTLTNVTPSELASWLDDASAVLVDVREPAEYASEHIPGSVSAPLSSFDGAALRSAHGGDGGAEFVFQCQTGRRSAEAAERFGREGGSEAVYHLAGGIEAWKRDGRAVERSAGAARIPIMRQVQIVAGSLVVVGVALSAFVSPSFLILAAFVGCGLVFAGVTGWCGMARLLGAAPWNR